MSRKKARPAVAGTSARHARRSHSWATAKLALPTTKEQSAHIVEVLVGDAVCEVGVVVHGGHWKRVGGALGNMAKARPDKHHMSPRASATPGTSPPLVLSLGSYHLSITHFLSQPTTPIHRTSTLHSEYSIRSVLILLHSLLHSRLKHQAVDWRSNLGSNIPHSPADRVS